MEKYTMLFAKLTTCCSVREDAEKREPSYTVGGNVNGAATMENSMDSPQKVKSRTTIWSSYSTSWYLSEEYQNTNTRRYVHCMFIVALFTIAKIWMHPKGPSAGE